MTDLSHADPVVIVRSEPIRQVRGPAGQRHSCGWFWSATTGGHLVYESRLELDRMWLADFAPDAARVLSLSAPLRPAFYCWCHERVDGRTDPYG